MRAYLPSLAALSVFEAAARHLSFTRAGEELGLTQGAVSRQVAQLEGLLGVPLFERVRQRVMLSAAGSAYLAEIRPILERLTAATVNAMASRGLGGVLNLAVLPTFGTRWLIPRLGGFIERHPDITINFVTRIVPFDFDTDALDAAIHFGRAVWPGAVLHRLMGEEIVPVASPGLIEREHLGAPADALRVMLLEQVTRPNAWRHWLVAQGLNPDKARPGARFEQLAMVAQAAIAGLGLAILPRFLIEDELRTGALRMPFGRPMVGEDGYYLVYPREKAAQPSVAAFRDWLLAECVART